MIVLLICRILCSHVSVWECIYLRKNNVCIKSSETINSVIDSFIHTILCMYIYTCVGMYVLQFS